ncbi:MAG TPA: pilus assembly protein N-terminal domain-containing protein [Xanthobacteraceae bacterium]|nr:pilus assembly protein N-terminal domain-containing protein [Xanthobacteraceae bacterium]
MGVRPGRSTWGRCRRHVLLAFAVAAAAATMRDADAGALTVVLDQAQIMKLPDRVGTIIIGNPLIADVSLQAGGMMVITGKGYGATNIIALDRAGATLMTTTVQVVGPRDNVVVVYRGMDRESYSCAPKCERRITLGDAPPYFDANLGQVGSRTTSAVGTQGH